ncbi:efflux RND transporter periplasmic adaptor subunit [Stakelama sp. CBK3Z-3]|uniref:Efflux RND transporter periplasmic adaptor subunit n=1 Tax=Stakelama flava TaxID=2860338 RepID=A0ABS6XMZ1_9SPHN|nr:efflux RND transporter periplasmic adaptor subunit [Stakelama flava]
MVRLTAPVLACALLASCGSSDDQAGQAGQGQGQGGAPVPVGVVTVKQANVPLITDLAGRTSAYESSEVRPQVSGVIRKRLFTQGSIVRAGQTLYRIDPAPYEADVQQAQANLQSAQATLKAAKVKADRYEPLAKMQAISQQDYTDAQAQANEAAASVAQAKAALRTAKINLNRTTVPAPITGRIGRSVATVGALVTENQSDALTTIQRLDPIYVDIRQSSGDILALRRALGKGDTVASKANVRLTLEDGEDYGRVGTVDFAEPTVDESTGTVTLRATFPNPEGLLLPGMYVTAHIAQAIQRDAILVPQQGVTRDPKGNATVLVVGDGNKVVSRSVKAPRTQGAYWVVTSGLNPGDKVIVQGTAKVRPGQPVKPVPADTPQKLTTGTKGAGGGGNSSAGAGS